MPIERVKKSVISTASKIRRHWSRDEAHRREQMAVLMQAQLLTVLGFKPAPLPVFKR